MPTHSVTHTVVFSCKHQRIFQHPPRKGETAYCSTCRTDRVVWIAPAEWRVTCRDCRLSRGHGRARLSAEGQVISHRRKQPTHRVQLWNGAHLEWEWDALREGQLELDMSGEPPY